MPRRRMVVACLALASACGRQNFNEDDAEPVDAAIDAALPTNLVFVTSAAHDGNFGGLAGADAYCQNAAEVAGRAGMYVAYLSDATTMAPARIASARGWTRVDGQPVADLPSQFSNRRAWYPIYIDETGADIRAVNPFVWTGTDVLGSPSVQNCVDWTSSAAGFQGVIGTMYAGGGRGVQVDLAKCNEPYRLYCFGIDLANPVAPPTRTTGRLAFLTSGTWAPSGGLAGADAACTQAAIDAGRPGTFRAALPTTTASTASRFNLTGPPWVRADGVALTATAAALFSSGTWLAHLTQDARGTLVEANAFWAGQPAPPTSSFTCRDWTSSVGSDLSYVGDADSTRHDELFQINMVGCDTPNRLLCLEN